jgi:hypothetical protein
LADGETLRVEADVLDTAEPLAVIAENAILKY